MRSFTDLAQVLIQTPSPKGNSLEAIKVLKTYFQQYDLDPYVLEYTLNEANLYIKIGPPNTSVVLISGHIDCVPPGDESRWQHPPFSGTLVDGELWGRGAVDMKASVAVMAELVVELSKQPLKRQLLFIVTAEEETGLFGSKEMVKQKIFTEDPITHILIGEPTGLQPLLLEKGVMWLRITANGAQAHASRPDLGANAINGLVKVLHDIPNTFPDREHELVGRTTMSITTIQGGSALNVGAESAIVTLDIRTPPGVENEMIIEEVRRVIDHHTESGLTFNLEILYNEPSIQSSDNTLAKLCSKTIWELTGREPEIGGAVYTTDGTVFMTSLPLPVPYVIFGPGSPELLHQTDERVPVSDLFSYKTALSQILMKLLG
ncbi:MAG: M20 family metallopeptidase [Candidatus Kariarchaeaceae archaeon]|jgi:succinyl-diaminopimelate desuccinylase